MAKLKLGPLADDRPVKLTVERPAPVHRDLVAYAAALAAESGGEARAPEKLVAPMLARFMASDRGFSRARAASRTDRTDEMSCRRIACGALHRQPLGEPLQYGPQSTACCALDTMQGSRAG